MGRDGRRSGMPRLGRCFALCMVGGFFLRYCLRKWCVQDVGSGVSDRLKFEGFCA